MARCTLLLLLISFVGSPSVVAQAVLEAPVLEAPVALQAQPRPAEWWAQRHAAKLAEKQAALDSGKPIRLVFIGDSITHGWENRGKELWAERFAAHGALNLGFSGDRTEHVLWRLGLGDAGDANNEVLGLSPDLFIVMIGTNNTGHSVGSPPETAQGVTAVVDRLQELSPESDILLLAIFPRAEKPTNPARLANDEVNQIIGELGDRERVEFLDLADVFLDDDGVLPKSVMPDLLHPHEVGYGLWADAIMPAIDRYLAD